MAWEYVISSIKLERKRQGPLNNTQGVFMDPVLTWHHGQDQRAIFGHQGQNCSPEQD